MSAVFSHGRLRLYLLKLLSEGPKHGYELIRLLENRFLGLYAPSAGTIYPRLARMEADGLVTHTAAGGRKVYEITDAGRAELTSRAAELASLEREIHESVADLSTLATEVAQGVRGSMRDIKRELRQQARTGGWRPPPQSWPEPVAPTSPVPEAGPAASGPAASGPAVSGPAVSGPAADLERHAVQLLAEVRRLARTGRVSAEAMRTAVVVVDTALDQIRRLLR